MGREGNVEKKAAAGAPRTNRDTETRPQVRRTSELRIASDAKNETSIK
jgi:hypothetical protein